MSGILIKMAAKKRGESGHPRSLGSIDHHSMIAPTRAHFEKRVIRAHSVPA